MPQIVTNTSTSAASPAAQDIRDIVPPLEITTGWEWVWWAAGTLLLVVMAAVAWYLWRKNRGRAPIIPTVPAHVRAKQKLQEALALITQPKPFVIAVSDTTRHYLEERFNFRAPERTTEEFLHELQRTNLLSRDQKDSLGEFLQSCDLVKFAKYEPGEPELRELHGSALRLVEETQVDEIETTPAPAAIPAPTLAPEKPAPESVGEKFTLKDRLIGFGLAAVLILIGLATWLWPHLHLVPQEALQDATLGRGGRRFVGILRIVEFLWSRPLGTLLAVVGACVMWGVFTRKYKGSTTET